MARKQLVYGFLTAFAMAVLSMCGPLTAAQEPTAEVWERAEALGREIQACGSNAMCIREVQRRMEEFNQELVEAYGGPQFPSPQELMEQEAMMQEIDQALAKRRGDPCYPVYHVKETGRRVRGSDLPWISCTPLEIRVRWEVEEHQSSSLPLNASLTIEEIYPGYLETVRGEDDRQHLISYEIRGPSESDPSSAVTRGSVTLTGYEVQGFPWDVIYTHRNFGTRNPADFSVDPSHSRLTFRYLRMEPPQSRVYEHRLAVGAPTVTVHVPAGGSELTEIFYISDVALDGSNGFTPEEIRTGLRIGHLMKTFPVRSEFSIPPYYSMQQKGTVTVTVLFDPEPSMRAEFPEALPYLSEPNSSEPGYVGIKEKQEVRSGRGPVSEGPDWREPGYVGIKEKKREVWSGRGPVSKSSEIPTVPQRHDGPVPVPEPVPYPDAGGTRKDDQAAREDKGVITRGSATPSSTGDEPGTCPPKCPDRQK